jgi:hypothetical protein
LKTTGVILKDTTAGAIIELNHEQAVSYLRQTSKNPNWKNPDDPLRIAIDRLLFESENEKFDSTISYLV